MEDIYQHEDKYQHSVPMATGPVVSHGWMIKQTNIFVADKGDYSTLAVGLPHRQ